jgi:REP element-mobilizing transposase RayT
MIRGLEKRAIFRDDGDRWDLLGRLCDLVPRWAGDCLGWTFMGNHVHFVLRTGQLPLAWLMRRLNTGYALHFNRRHERVGYLLQDRFKSRILDEKDDVRVLMRYVHLNPLRAGLVRDLVELECYPWCGYGALLGRRQPFAFENVALSLGLFDDDPRQARRRVRAWMSVEEEGAGVPKSGDESRIAQAPARTSQRPSAGADCGAPDRSSPSLEELIIGVAGHFGVAPAELARGARHDRASRARAAIAFIGVTQCRIPANRLAPILGVSPQAISKAITRGAGIAREEGPRLSPRGDLVD